MDCFSRLNMADMGLLCVCLWRIWYIRNAFVHHSPIVKEVAVLDWARIFIGEFQDAISDVNARLPGGI